MRRSAITAVFAILGLVLTGCGLGSGPLGKIDVSKDDVPKVTFKKDFSVEKTEALVVKEGKGDKVKKGDSIKVNYIALNGRTAKEFDNSFENERPMSLTLVEDGVLPGFYKGLVGQRIGSRVLVAVPPADGVEKLGSLDGLDLKKTDTMVFLFDIVSTVPAAASGEAQKAPANLPSIVFDKDKQPSGFKATKTSDKKLSKTQSAVVIKGDGPKIKAGQAVTAHYVGQKYPDGEVFDESRTSAPRQFAVGAGQLIACWDDELVGQTIGSRVIVACTAEDAYGKNAKAEGRPDGALIFVIDLLDAI